MGKLLVLALSSLLLVASAAWARGGGLDGTFGRGGVVRTSFGAGEAADGQAIALTGRQLIVVAGQVQTASGTSAMAVARYTSAGRLDPGFGSAGLVQTTCPGGATGLAVAVDGSGRVLVAGSSGNDIALARYTPAGQLDPTFGSAGRVITAFAGLEVSGDALVLLPDGGIVVAGGATRNDGTGGGFVLVRYAPSGALDSGFGNDGRVFTPFGAGADVVEAHSVAFSNGKLTAAGLLDNPFAGGGAFALARYDSGNGQLDPSFSSDGKVTTALGEEAGAQGVLVDPHGRIVAAGTAQLAPGQGDRFALTRYLTNGALDPGFGRRGVVATQLPGGDALANAIARQPDGRLVAVGQANQANGNSSIFGLVRYTPSGATDPTFGTAGIVTTSFGKSSLASANAVAIQTNGRIVVAGTNGLTFTLARYLP